MKEQKLIDTNESSSNDLSKNGSVDELTNRNVKIVRKLEESAKQERTKADLVAERIANFCGSMTFVWVHIVWFGGWIGFNIIPGLPHIDPFPFTFLTLVVSLEAIFLSTFILISQNYDAKISERRNHLDLQINLLSEQENTRMLALLRAIAESTQVNDKFYKPAFVTMEYFGYLRRDPEICVGSPDPANCGYIFHNARFQLTADQDFLENTIVRGFIESPEYIGRF